jgi:hypothetical protein
MVSSSPSESEAREKGAARRRDAKDAGRPAETRIERQQRQDEATNFAELPTACDWGCKRKSDKMRFSLAPKAKIWHNEFSRILQPCRCGFASSIRPRGLARRWRGRGFLQLPK